MNLPQNITTLLFDMDGVIFDTEGEYTEFWKRELLHLIPNETDIFAKIKGVTLTEILERYFPTEEMKKLVIELVDSFEKNLEFRYIAGFESYLKQAKAMGYKCAVVTSSSDNKMANVYASLPTFKGQFDTLVTADDVIYSKPNPQCFLLAAERLGVLPTECAVFEDSILGLKAGKAAGMYTIGLTTTNTIDVVEPLSDIAFANFTEM